MFTDIVYAMGGAPQDAGTAGQGGGAFNPIIMMLVIFGIFYFLIIRPQSKKAKEHKIMLANMKKGDKIITSGGIHGVIESVETDTLIIKIAENVKIKVSRGAVAALRTGE